MIIKIAQLVQIIGPFSSNQEWNPSLSHIVVRWVFFVIGQINLQEGEMLKGKTTLRQNDHNFAG